MDSFFVLITGEVTVAIYAVLTTVRRNRSRRTTICPETDQRAVMEFKAGHAGVITAIENPELRVKWCSQWPLRRDCAEECLITDWPTPREPPDKDLDAVKAADQSK